MSALAALGAQRRAVTAVWGLRLLVVAAFLLLWQLAISTGVVPERAFSRPLDVGRWFWDWHSTGDSLPHLRFTLTAAVVGYCLGIAIGALLAFVFVFVRGVSLVFQPIMGFLNGIPKVILAPFLVTVLGLGIASKVAVAMLLVLFLAFFNISDGLRSVDPMLRANLTAMCAGRIDLFWNLYLPAVGTWVVSSLRTGFGFALIGVVVGEFIASDEGVGFTIRDAASLNNAAAMLGGLITLGVVGLLVDLGLSVLERRFSAWRLF